jgi:diguanylate cyclase (GGDEF)-like protein
LIVTLSYILERMRRMMFLVTHAMQDIHERQESWAYTLIDLDMALSGIQDFDELIRRLMEYLASAIHHDSYILTSLEGKGPEPEPDVIEGTLFQQEDNTLWPESLLTKLSQTRQTDTSAVYDTKKGFLGREQQLFKHFRMDIPVFNDSSMVGVISLRRESEAFDDLDSTAAVSLATQAMMIFKRSNMANQMSQTIIKKASELAQKHQVEHEDKVAKAASKEIHPKAEAGLPDVSDSSPTTYDMEITGADTTDIRAGGEEGRRDGRETVMPKDLVRQMREKSESSKRTITLLSRENADKIAVDRYRTAAVEGEPLSILLFEVDGLSAMREQDGDQTAYKVFAGIVKHIFSKVNSERDVLGRYGQNGLSVLLPNIDMNAAEKFAEGIRQHIEQARFKTPYGERLATVSVGVAAITDETGNYDSMVKRADMALFVAKKNGRNCVKVRL